MDKHAVVHFEIYADDLDKLSEFYKSMFGWSVDSVPGMPDYRYVKTIATDERGAPTTPGGINGGMMTRPMPEARFWINYVNVDSVDQSASQAEKLGATVHKKGSAPGMGRFAILSDPQGNPFGLWQTDPNAK